MNTVADSTGEALRAALYGRVSSKKQGPDRRRRDAGTEAEGKETETSLDTQIAACRRKAAAQGWVVDDEHVYREVYRGTELWGRPELSKLRDAIRRRAVDVLVVNSTDRLSRDPDHLTLILLEAEHAGVAIDFVTEPLDDSLEGSLIRFVRGFAGKIDNTRLREASMRGKRARRPGGTSPGTARPTGWPGATGARAA